MNAARAVRVVKWIAAIVLLIVIWSLLSPDLPAAATGLLATLHRPLFHLGTTVVTLAVLAKSVLFFGILMMGVGMLRRVLIERVLIRTGMSTGQRYATARIIGYVVYLLAVVIGLQTTGLDLSSLAVFGGAVGIGLGLGLQDVTNNFVSGLILLVEHPVRVGDRIEIDGLSGDVEKIGARSTWVRTNDNVVIVVPNSQFTTQRVTNWTGNDRTVRFSVPLGVSYSANPEQVRKILLDIAVKHPDVLKRPAPDVIFEEFGDSSLNFSLRVWTSTRVQTPQVLRSDLYFTIFEAFGAEGIEIPFPQRDLRLRSADAEIRVKLERAPEAPAAEENH